MEIPLNKKEWNSFKDEVLAIAKHCRPLPLRQMLLWVQELPDYRDQESFYFTAMLRDLYRFQQSTLKMLEWLEELRQKDAVRVNKAKPPPGAEKIVTNDRDFIDDESPLQV